MRTTRYVLFGILAATVVAVIAPIITSNVEQGPTNTYEVVTDQPAPQSDLRTDAAALEMHFRARGISQAIAACRSIPLELERDPVVFALRQ